MTISELARIFNARGSGKRIRARCPVHGGKSLTLALYDDGDKLGVNCFAGCSQDDVLAAVGLRWQDLRPERERLPPKEYAALLRRREADEEKARNLRIGTWILRFAKNGYTAEDRQTDVSMACLATEALSVKVTPAWERICAMHMERIQAANHCIERGIKMANKAELIEWASSFSDDVLHNLIAEAMAYRAIRMAATLDELKEAFQPAAKAARDAKDDALLDSFTAIKDKRKGELTA